MKVNFSLFLIVILVFSFSIIPSVLSFNKEQILLAQETEKTDEIQDEPAVDDREKFRMDRREAIRKAMEEQRKRIESQSQEETSLK